MIEKRKEEGDMLLKHKYMRTLAHTYTHTQTQTCIHILKSNLCNRYLVLSFLVFFIFFFFGRFNSQLLV